MSEVTVPYFIREVDEEESLRALDKLLWEYGFTLFQEHALTPIAAARSWFHLVDDTDILPKNNYDGTAVLEPLEVTEEEIDKQIIIVEWIVADDINRVEGDTDCRKGGLLFLHHSSTSPKGVASIGAGDVWPVDGLIYPTNFTYRGDALPSILEESRERLRIIYAYNQCIEYEGETEDIEVELAEHSAKQSRVVFRNSNTARAVRLRGFLIRGSAVYTQGNFRVLGGIYTEPFEFTSGAVIRGTNSVGYTLPATASDQDNFYVGWRLRTENGTDQVITSYGGASKIAAISNIHAVSPVDAVDTLLLIVPPNVGLSEDVYKSDNIYDDISARRLALGLINLIEFGRYTYEFSLLQSFNQVTGAAARVRATIDGRLITVTYNKLLNSMNVPQNGRFTINVQGTTSRPTSVRVSGSSVLLYLSSAVMPGQGVLLTYRQPSVNRRLRTVADEDIPSFSNIVITNVTSVRRDLSAPELQSATVNYSVVTITFDENLNVGFVPGTSAFAIVENGALRRISGITLSGMSVTITLTDTVRVGSNVYLAYTAPISNRLRDVDGNFVDSIGSQRLDNITGLQARNTRLRASSVSIDFGETIDPVSIPDTSAFTVTDSG